MPGSGDKPAEGPGSTPSAPTLPLDGLARFTVPPLRLEDFTQLDGDPPGLSIAHDVVTPAHERALVAYFQTQLEWPSLRPDAADPNFASNPSCDNPTAVSPADSPLGPGHAEQVTPRKPPRRSLHYGYRFCYRTFAIDRSVPFTPFPHWLAPLVPTWRGEPPAQVCLQHYPPGAGIPPHTDTHSAFDELCGLSLGAPVHMDFRRRWSEEAEDGEMVGKKDGEDGEHDKRNNVVEPRVTNVVVDLPPRSMLRMDGDARLHWTHGIRKRKTDLLPDGTTRPRGHRWSITFRWLRTSKDGTRAECECGDAELCDSEARRRGVGRYYRWKSEVG